MKIPMDRDRMISRVLGRNVEISKEDFHNFLGVSISGPSVHLSATNREFNLVALNDAL